MKRAFSFVLTHFIVQLSYILINEKAVIVLTRSNLHDILFLIVASVQEWKKDLAHVPERLYKAHHEFIRICAISNVTPPATIPDFVERLLQPIKGWGIDGFSAIFPTEERVLESDNSLSFVALEFLENYEDKEAYSIMKQILHHCREHDYDDDYRKIRIFLSKKENAVISYLDLYNFSGTLGDQKLKELFFKCYEAFQTSIARKCPHCGWTLLQIDGDWRCNRENICHSFGEFYHLEKFHEGENEHRMIDSIHRYVLLPGLSELSIAEKLEKKTFEVTLYPDVDLYDIFIKKGGVSKKIDVKDYTSPFLLAERIYQDTMRDNFDEAMVYVIPEYRLKQNALYLEECRQYFRSLSTQRPEIKGERTFLKEVGELV